VLLDLHWSALVHAAAQRNLRAWGWVVGDAPLDEDRGEGDTHAPLPRTLALHLRRGDYEAHCVNLRKWGAGFLGVNEAEGLGDRWVLFSGPCRLGFFSGMCRRAYFALIGIRFLGAALPALPSGPSLRVGAGPRWMTLSST
jgi:hypothetical protein